MGLLSAGLCLGDLSFAQRYQAALAQPTARKLALLVGINQYPNLNRAAALQGSLTDVELQRELLTHRFGFSPQDILTLVDAEATRSSIEAAFIAHLSDQARPGDIVVFHFSGYGCLVRTKSLLEQGEQSYGDQQALVAYDAGLLDPNGVPILNAIYEDTLFLLLRSLPTDQVTTLLDCGILPTNTLRCQSIRERSLPTWDIPALLGAELMVQNRLLGQTQLTRDQVQVQRQSGQLPGLVLAAASAKQTTALERDYDRFSAGLLTSTIAQQLWANTPASSITIQVGKLSDQIATQVGASAQQPTAKGQNSQGMLTWSTSFLSMPAVGIVSLVDRRGKLGKLWLGGLPDMLLEQYSLQSCFRALSRDAQAIPWLDAPTPTWVQLRSRQGKTAIAQHLSGPLLQEGLFLEEAIRVLPRAISLRLALGSNLSRIERVDASSVVSKRSSLRIVGSKQPADYIFTQLRVPMPDLAAVKISSITPLMLSLSTPPTQSYGLANLGGAVISNTVGDRGEVVKRAIERLEPTLDTLLAMKLLEMSLNHSAAALRISATLEQVTETPQPLMRRQSMGVVLPLPSGEATEPAAPKADKTSKVFSIPSGTLIQYRISNWDSVAIYLLLVEFSSGASAFASYALNSSSPAEDRKPVLKPIVVQPGGSVLLPVTTQAWKASGTAGLNKIFVLGTRQPLVQTLAAQMSGMKSLPSMSPGFAAVVQPLAIAQAIFADLHQLSLPKTTALGIKDQGLWAFDIEEWVTLQFVYTTV
jgi:hypothetical protein